MPEDAGAPRDGEPALVDAAPDAEPLGLLEPELQPLEGVEVVPLAPLVTKTYDQEERHDRIRMVLVASLLGIMAAEIVAALALIFLWPDRTEHLEKILAITFGPVVTLLGTATGFFFAERRSR